VIAKELLILIGCVVIKEGKKGEENRNSTDLDTAGTKQIWDRFSKPVQFE